MDRMVKSRSTRRTLLIAGGSSLAVGVLAACNPFSSDETAPVFTETTSAVGMAESAAREPVWTSTGEPFSGPPAARSNAEVGEEYQLAQETEKLRLYVDPTLGKVVVEDKRSGKLWRSNPVEPAKRKTLLQNAVFLLNFTNDRLQMTNLASSASENPELRIEKLDGGGVREIFNLTKRKITLALDLRLTDDYLEVSIPDDQIEENGTFRVVSIEVLPLFGSAKVGSDGYVMIPDGSGALVSFKSEFPQYRQRYSGVVYGEDAGGRAFRRLAGSVRQRTYSEQPWLPIWGLKDGDHAYVGMVTQGDFEANINAYLSGYITDRNRASAEFLYRRQASIPRRRTLFVNRIEERRLLGPRKLRYVLLNDDDANYVGMAKAYRRYLTGTRGVQRITERPRPYLQIFMGITRRIGFFDEFVQMTTFEQAREIVQAFLDKGLTDFDVSLLGWNDDGFRGRFPRRYPAESDLGGDGELRKLINFAHGNGLRVIFNDDYLYGYTRYNGGIIGQIPGIRNIWKNFAYGFNTRFDVMRGVNKLAINQGRGDVYLINPYIARTRYAASDIPLHKRMKADGVEFRYFGRFVLSDTNELYPLRREAVAAEWMQIVDEAKASLGGPVSIEGANAYALGHADRIIETPMDSTDAFADLPVPVYQIATHGLVNLMAPLANLRNDPRREFLRQIEWGAQPTYQLTFQPSAGLIRTRHHELFSSLYTDWVDEAAAEYKVFHEELGHLATKFIENHEQLMDEVYRTTFEDGTRIVVNYRDEAVTVGGQRIGPKDYVVQ